MDILIEAFKELNKNKETLDETIMFDPKEVKEALRKFYHKYSKDKSEIALFNIDYKIDHLEDGDALSEFYDIRKKLKEANCTDPEMIDLFNMDEPVGYNENLNEDIESVYQNVYAEGKPKFIDRDTFNKILNLDPFSKSKMVDGKDKGSISGYAKWLINLQLSGSDVLSKAKEITDLIGQFDRDKNKFPADQRDINKFKSIDDFKEFIENGSKSNFRKEAEKRNDVRFIVASNNYEVYRPLTRDGNRFTRGGENGCQWCTGNQSWSSYVSSEDDAIYDFLHKDSLGVKDQRHWQVYYSDGAFREIEDGKNGQYGGGIGATGHEGARIFTEFLLREPDLAIKLLNTEMGKYKEVQQVGALFKELEDSDGTITYDGKLLSLNPDKPEVNIDLDIPESSYRSLIKHIKIAPGVTIVKPFGLHNYSNVSEITIPSSVTNIHPFAFRDCLSLKNIYFEKPYNLKTIGGFAFQGCKNLKLISIPPTCEYIGAHAFIDCSSLKIHILTKEGQTNLHWDEVNRRMLDAKWKLGRVKILDVNEDQINK